MSTNLTSGRYNRRKKPSHIAYDNMLGAGLMMQRSEDDMKRTWKEQMIKIQHAQKLKESKDKKGRFDMARCFTPCPLELHKTPLRHHHWNPCIFLPQNHIRYGPI